ncbi:uncharacterized protein LOC106013098 [Aplysia californica]|uniref:Uncharacterized protein LOC106013098 n=1 Tax=Aplysia californica TaxID=6500 RepID=A0ABM1A9E6_APLCA|nr:uncharacterized protein LOC106013098 [Aplysia californica]
MALLRCVLLTLALCIVDAARVCERLYKCSRPLEQYEFTAMGSDALINLSQERVLDDFCGQVPTLEQCVHRLTASCAHPSVRNEVDSTVEVSKYMCSLKGRSQLLSLGDSACALDNTLLTAMSARIQDCFLTFTTHLQRLMQHAAHRGTHPSPAQTCPHTVMLRECLSQQTEDTCGPEFKTFLLDVFNLSASRIFEPLGCTQQARHSKRLVTRALNLQEQLRR